ncbi:MAG: hypothetical protein HON23_05145 [Rickettsiales bacterium]|jgi:hypothetical protein|nr:hypothetical protein [Rickettsiales bacterium]
MSEVASADDMGQVELLVFQHGILKHIPEQLELANQKIEYFYQHHYIPNKKVRGYVRHLIEEGV